MVIAASVLLPIGASAGVRVSINAHVSNNQQYEYADEGDPWFEDGDERGVEKISYEFQWSIYGGNHVLRCRQVNFHISNNSWTFGPWMIRDGYCHQSCHIHHQHHYYHHKVIDRHWRREYVRGGHQGAPHYYYVYRPMYQHGPSHQRAYRYEYHRDRYDHGDNQRHDNDRQDHDEHHDDHGDHHDHH
jgi:hypothetical protein